MTGTDGSTGPNRTGGASHLARLSRVYSHETWSLYELLQRSLDPRGPDWLHTRAGEYLTPGSVVLDAGCRAGAHLIRLVQEFDVVGVGVEPVAIHVERARAAVAAARLDERIQIVHGAMEDCAYPDDYFDFVWCRDVLEQVEPLVPAVQDAARVLKPNGRMLVYTTVATDLLEPGEAAMLKHHLGSVEPNLDERNIEAAFDSAGLTIEDMLRAVTRADSHRDAVTNPPGSCRRLAPSRRPLRILRTVFAVLAWLESGVTRSLEASSGLKENDP